MAQFDVHHNRGALRDSIPFVVLVQSAQFLTAAEGEIWPHHRSSLLFVRETGPNWVKLGYKLGKLGSEGKSRNWVSNWV